jgi:putative DNA primase/helicase
MARTHEAHPTERADLHGKRLVVAVETEDGRRLAESLVKELTGGDTIRARRMKENFFEFAPTHKLVLCTNHKPTIRGSDNGIWRRIRLVPFNARFWNPDEPRKPGEDRPEHLKADKAMKEKLLAEREGILAWMVRGCLDWRRSGLGLPRKVAEATSEYRDEEDLRGRFVGEVCQLGKDEGGKEYRVKASHLYLAFKEWGLGQGIAEPDLPTQRSFGLAMTAAGFRRNARGSIYLGIRIRPKSTADLSDEE